MVDPLTGCVEHVAYFESCCASALLLSNLYLFLCSSEASLDFICYPRVRASELFSRFKVRDVGATRTGILGRVVRQLCCYQTCIYLCAL